MAVLLGANMPRFFRHATHWAKRAAFGLARTGTICDDGSGDFVIAFSTAARWRHEPADAVETSERLAEGGKTIDAFFAATIEAVEEAILNALVAAETLTGRDGNTLHAIPHDRLADVLRTYHIIE